MMKMRRYISLLLLAVYLFAVGGPSYASLSCRCVALKSHETTLGCCHRTLHIQPGTGDALSAPCCANHHSTEIKLYTGTSSDDARNTRFAIIALPASLTTECLAPADPLVSCEKVCERRAPFLKEAFLLSVGFRAPPVLV